MSATSIQRHPHLTVRRQHGRAGELGLYWLCDDRYHADDDRHWVASVNAADQEEAEAKLYGDEELARMVRDREPERWDGMS